MSEFAVGSPAYAAFCARHEHGIRDTVEDALDAKAEAAYSRGDHDETRAINRVLRRRRLFNRVVEKVQAEAVPVFLQAQADGAVGADGEFFKWLLDWFSQPENWQGILQFIMALVQLFGSFASWLLPLLAWCGLAIVGAAAQGQIICQDQYPLYTQIVLDLEPGPSDATYRDVIWQFSPPRISGLNLPDGRIAFTAPPGRYEVLASVVSGSNDGGKVTLAENGHQLHRASFVIGDATEPIDDDDDGQVDPPLPPVVIEGAVVLVVEESAERTPETAKLLADAAYWQTIVDRGMRWRVYDIDSPTAAGLRGQIGQTPLPALIIVDKAMKVLAVKELPADKVAIDAIIKETTGK